MTKLTNKPLPRRLTVKAFTLSRLASVIFIGLLSLLASAQEHHKQHQMKEKPEADTTRAAATAPGEESIMTSRYSRSLPMSRDGSGTSWLPDASPMYMYMKHSGNWNFMLHGNIFLRYNIQDVGRQSSRGSSQADAPNMFMGMAQRKVGSRGLFNMNLMLSLDRLVMGGDGYPLLFQTGETWKGARLVDRQHPHDLFAELSIAYTHKISEDADITGYLGYPGEPALGPVTFMHRPSSYSNPDAPLGHHWQDASHITFGVATVGLRYKKVKLEASSFTGREPDENRYDFDAPRFTSFSQRISYAASASWVFQASHGLLKSPEALEPDENVRRVTASAIHSSAIHNGHYWSNSFVAGLNQSHHSTGLTLLYESQLQIRRTGLYGRAEWVQKDSVELQLRNVEGAHLNVGAITLGGSYRLIQAYNTDMNVGAQTTVFMPGNELRTIYGNTPMAVELYLHITPSLMMNRKPAAHEGH